MIDYSPQILDILEAGRVKLSTIKPSDWTEANMIMTKPFPGPFKYDRTPYTREIIDCFAPDHPAKIISVMKGAQIGFSAGVLYPVVGWIIANQPGNTLFMVGHEDLVDETMNKVDLMIDSTGLRKLIRPSVQRNKAGKTGDTNKKKEFPGGYLVLGSASNHKLLRQRDMQYGLIDDFEAVKRASKESGDTRKLIEQRFAAYGDKMKLAYISTPELKQTSNIEPAFLLGDQRRYLIPCSCCGEAISLHWTITEGDITGGITYQLDNRNRVIKDSVGYICQKCGGFFNDRNKYEFLNAGFWNPTAEPSREGYYSYHLSSLYAPAGMYDWAHYAQDYVDAHPVGGKRVEHLYKSFVNLCLGETYEETGEEIKANQLQQNIRPYDVYTIPEKLSVNDGNGTVVLITCACDLNGVEDDARLDYEVVAWTESGSSYSIEHGSIGTFIRKENSKKTKIDRERWTYDYYKHNSVWPELNKVLGRAYKTDTGRNMKIFMTGIDCGHHTIHAYTFIDKSNFLVIGVRGIDADKYTKYSADLSIFRPAKERAKLYLLEVNKIKDMLAEYVNLKWDERADEAQPPGFMNFPMPEKGLYLYNNFFAHYEAEHRVIESKEGEGIAARWVKKSSNVENHLFDCRVYNIAIKEILVSKVCKELKIINHTWSDYVSIILSSIKK